MRELVLRLNNILKQSSQPPCTMPSGLVFTDNEFFVSDTTNISASPKVFTLSREEKKLLRHLTQPIGNIVPASPMVAKRLRNKLNIVLSHIDILTIRGQGYKLIDKSANPNNKNGN